jgi:hypothetical protein
LKYLLLAACVLALTACGSGHSTSVPAITAIPQPKAPVSRPPLPSAPQLVLLQRVQSIDGTNQTVWIDANGLADAWEFLGEESEYPHQYFALAPAALAHLRELVSTVEARGVAVPSSGYGPTVTFRVKLAGDRWLPTAEGTPPGPLGKLISYLDRLLTAHCC